MTLGYEPAEVCAAAVQAGVVSREDEVGAVRRARQPGGAVDWANQRLLGLPNPVTHWNKFGG